MRSTTLALPFLLTACLPAAAPPQGQDASSGVAEDGGRDAGPPVPPRVLGVEVFDRRAAPWPIGGIPQRPLLRVSLSEPPRDDEGGPPVWLFAGPSDADLSSDLEAYPLRIGTLARVVPASVESSGTALVLEPDARLEPGAVLTLAVGGWLRSERTGLRMGLPWAQELTVSAAPEAGARVAESWPPDGTADVPPSIPTLAVRFDGPISGAGEGLTLRDEDGEPIAGAARLAQCTTLGWAQGFCATFTPDRPLAPARAHELRVGSAVLDATGAPVGPWSGRFTTGSGVDEPPALLALPCGLDEQSLDGACMLADDGRIVVRLQADEPVRVALSLAGRTVLATAPRGGAVLVAAGLPPDTAFEALLRLEDLGGLVLERTLSLRTAEPLATVSIVEVRADPRGPEPRQEYVEVLNFGGESVDLEGMWLSDRADSPGDAIGPQRLAPGQRALLVADDFDPEDPADPRVPPGVPLVRLGRSIASGGLSNAGEPLFLRDAGMRRLSAVPALGSGEPGACVVRTGEDPRGEAPRQFSIGPCTPGLAPSAR